MLGAIAGDIIGCRVWEKEYQEDGFSAVLTVSTFTDDTMLTVAVADCLLSGKDYAAALREYGRCYPHAGYGGFFLRWLFDDRAGPYNSFGNGSAMRVSPVGFACASLEAVLAEAERSAAVTHPPDI